MKFDLNWNLNSKKSNRGSLLLFVVTGTSFSLIWAGKCLRDRAHYCRVELGNAEGA